ncbi:MAG: hypothetical protein EBS84_20740, partial [Proteobacteria bacterium]|nr:hypothetical protein [Pseudomonadota bacterium]
MSTPQLLPGGMSEPHPADAKMKQPCSLLAKLEPKEAAAAFLKQQAMAFSESPKRFFLFDAGQSKWLSITTNNLHRRVRAWLEQQNQSPTATYLKKLTSELELLAPLWDSRLKPGQMVVANGVLDVNPQPPSLSQRDQSIHFEHSLAVDYLADARCPRFEQFLGDALSVEDVGLVQKWAGSLLAGPNQSQTILVVVGASGTGKGTLVNLLTRLVGLELTAELRAEQLTERFEMSAFLGKRLLVASEIAPDLLNLKGIGRLKALVGQDCMEAELKRANQRTRFNGDFHVILYGNQLNPQPWSADLDAFRRRLLIVEYAKPRPSTIIPNLADEVWLEEGSGILTWAVEGVRCYRADLLKSGHFVLT